MQWDAEKTGNVVVLTFFLILTAAAFIYAIWAH
jgi:hypothetical protein